MKGVYKMKNKRILGLAVIALLAVGGLGFTSASLAASAQKASSQQAQVTSVAIDPELPGSEEITTGPDTDNIQQQVGEQVGPQVEDGLPDSAQAPTEGDAGSNLQMPGKSSSSTTQRMSSTTGIAAANPAKVVFVNANAAPLASTPNTSNSGITTQAGQQIEDGLPDGVEATGGEEVANGLDTDNIQQQVGAQSGQQVEDGQPDSLAAPGK
jgi:hypothetical protein